MDNIGQTVASHSSEVMKLKERMNKMEVGEVVQTTEKGDRQTRRRKMMERLEMGGEWCPTFIILGELGD